MDEKIEELRGYLTAARDTYKTVGGLYRGQNMELAANIYELVTNDMQTALDFIYNEEV